MEVVSESNRKLDTETKRDEYEKAAIAEYWIVDPPRQRITVLALGPAGYRVTGEHAPGSRATSVLLPGFELDVAAVLRG